MKHCNTKQIKAAYEQFKRSRITELWQCYDKYSYNKEKAMEYCKKLANKYHANSWVCILGYNTCTFSVGFVGTFNGEPAFFYITKDYDRFIYLDELEG